MFRPASSTTPVTAAADQIDGGCAPAPAAHAVTSNTVISVVRTLGIGFTFHVRDLSEILTAITRGDRVRRRASGWPARWTFSASSVSRAGAIFHAAAQAPAFARTFQ